MKQDGRLERNFLKGRHGDKVYANLAGTGHNFSMLLKWLEFLRQNLADLIWVQTPEAA